MPDPFRCAARGTLTGIAAVLLWISIPTPAGAQALVGELRFEHLAIKDGLSHSVVRAVLQDRIGFIWIATQDGLNLYDGHRVTTFRHAPGDDNSLPSNFVTSLAETSGPEGARLWVGTNRGLVAYDAARHRFTRYLHKPGDPGSPSHDFVQSLLVDADGVLWAGTSGGLDRFDRQSGKFTRHQHDPRDPASLSQSFVRALAEGPRGTLWAGTARGLNRVDKATGRVTRFVHSDSDPGSLNDDHIRALLTDRKGRLWIGTDAGGLDRLDPGSPAFVHHVQRAAPGSISGNSINAIAEDGNGDLWVGVWGGGVNRMTPDGRFRAYRHRPIDPHTLPIDDINALTIDRSGLVWVGTYGGGLSRFNPRAAREFVHLKHRPDDAGSLSDNRVHAALVGRDGHLWVGTWGGLNRLAPGAENFQRFTHDRANAAGLGDNRVTSLAESHDGAIWAGSLDGGLHRIDPRTSRIQRYRHEPRRPGTLSSDDVLTLYVDKAGTLWAGTLLDGLNRRDAATGTFTTVSHDPGNNDTLSDNRPTAMFEDSRGTFWVGTGAGLDVLDRATGRVTRFHGREGAPAALSTFIASIEETPDGALWIGTADDGVIRIDRDSNGVPLRYASYREKEGLPNDRIYKVVADAQGQVWVTTNNGVGRIDPKDGSIRRFHAVDGLQENEFKAAGFFDRRTGRLFLGGINGLSIVQPEQLNVESQPPPVVLTDFTVFRRPVKVGGASPLQARIADTDDITLTHEDEVFSVEFAALEYWAPSKIQYAFLLEGFDRDWNHADASRRAATYTNLGPGRYTFVVRASSRDGEWTGEPRRLRIVILPPFWKTWWFRMLLTLAAVAAILGVNRWRFRTLERQRRTLESQVAARTSELRKEKENVSAALRLAERAGAARRMFLTNISHEIRTPLNAIIGMADMLKDTPLDEEQQEYAGALRAAGAALSELIEDTLELSKLEVGRVDLDLVLFDLRPLVLETVAILTLRARQKGLELACTIAPDVPERVNGDPRALRRVLINLLGNAVKFTEKGSVLLRVESPANAAAGALVFSITDTGIGIPAEKHELIFENFTQADASISREYGGTGLGLAISRQLVELMGGRLAVDSAPGRGSTFRFTAVLPEAPRSDFDFLSASNSRIVPQRPLRILLVEDAPQNRLLMSAYLKDMPDVVDVAEDGSSAVEKFTSGRYDIVLMDVHMPVMDGYTATRAIREWEAGRHNGRTPIVALTANGYAEDIESSRLAGCDAHLTKPISKAVLLNMLDRYRTG